MKSRLVSILMLVLACSYISAQKIALSGVVVDIKSGEPLQGAVVRLTDSELDATTDEYGRFRIVSAVPVKSGFATGLTSKFGLRISQADYLDLNKPLDTLDHNDLVIEMGKIEEFEGGWARVPEILAHITAPGFPDRDFRVTDYGADGDGVANNYKAFKKAIEACHRAGGGRVLVPEGTYRMEGPIHLLSNVNLHLGKGSLLDFHWDPDGYLVGDAVHRGRILVRWEGTWIYNYSPLIYAWNQKNIGLTGPGEINGNGLDPDWPDHIDKVRKNEWAHKGVPIDNRITDELTPGTIEFYFCENVLFEDFTSKEPNERNVHPVMCSNVTIRGLNILPTSPSHKEDDGIDPDGCQYVLIEDCRIQSYDDNIGIKSGRDNDGWMAELEDPEGKWYQEIPGRTSKFILIRNNWFHGGFHNMVGIGSDQSSGAEYIYAWDCQAGQVVPQRHILSVKTNPNRGGEVRHIYIRDIRAKYCDGILKAGHRYMSFYAKDGPQRLPRTHHIFMDNIMVENGGKTAFVFEGWDEEPMHDFFFQNIQIPEGKTARYTGVDKSTISAINVRIAGKIWESYLIPLQKPAQDQR